MDHPRDMVERTVIETNKNVGASLWIAAQKGQVTVIEYLLNQGAADLNETDVDGRTPLHHAAQNGHLAVVKYLLSQSAIIDTTDNQYATPLSLAAQGGYLEIVNILVKAQHQASKEIN